MCLPWSIRFIILRSYTQEFVFLQRLILMTCLYTFQILSHAALKKMIKLIMLIHLVPDINLYYYPRFKFSIFAPTVNLLISASRVSKSSVRIGAEKVPSCNTKIISQVSRKVEKI